MRMQQVSQSAISTQLSKATTDSLNLVSLFTRIVSEVAIVMRKAPIMKGKG